MSKLRSYRKGELYTVDYNPVLRIQAVSAHRITKAELVPQIRNIRVFAPQCCANEHGCSVCKYAVVFKDARQACYRR